MKSWPALAIVSSLMFAACSAPSGGSPAASGAATFVFKADLKATNEVPPVTDAEASCSGTATLTLKDSSKTADVDVTVSGCPTSAAVNLGMVHQGAAGANGAVKIDFMKTGDLVITAGAGKLSKTNLTVDPAVFADIIANPSGWYVNLHSTLHGGGVIRGQLTKG